MLNAFFRTSILFFITAIVLRLMGKRQLADFQRRGMKKARRGLAYIYCWVF